MADAIQLTQFYLGEAKRLAEAAAISERVEQAEQLRRWILECWPDRARALGRTPQTILPGDVVQYGPKSFRETQKAKELLNVLADHGWLHHLETGTVIDGASRSLAFSIVRSERRLSFSTLWRRWQKIQNQRDIPAKTANPAKKGAENRPHLASLADLAAPTSQNAEIQVGTDDPPELPRHAPQHGLVPAKASVGGRPVTWTGKVVSLEEWRRLTDWEKHGPNGRMWNGKTRKWERENEQ